MDNSRGLHAISQALKGVLVVSLVLGIVLVLIQELFTTRWLSLSMWGFFGLAAAADGLHAVLTQKALFLPRAVQERLDGNTGIAARLLGAILFLFGIGLAGWAFGDLLWPGQVGALLELFEGPQRWGLLSGVVGIVLGLYGWARLLAGPEYRRAGTLGDLQDAAYRGVGGFLVLLGAGLTVLGFLLLAAPDIITRVLGQ